MLYVLYRHWWRRCQGIKSNTQVTIFSVKSKIKIVRFDSIRMESHTYRETLIHNNVSVNSWAINKKWIQKKTYKCVCLSMVVIDSKLARLFKYVSDRVRAHMANSQSIDFAFWNDFANFDEFKQRSNLSIFFQLISVCYCYLANPFRIYNWKTNQISHMPNDYRNIELKIKFSKWLNSIDIE